MKQLKKHFRGHGRALVLGPLFKLFEAVLELFVPLIMADIIDIGIRLGDVGYILVRGLLLLAIAGAGMGAALVCQYNAAKVAGHFGRSLRKEAFSHALRLSDRDLGEMGTGGLITRLTHDINQIQTGINMAIRLGIRAPFLAIGSIVMAISLDRKIGMLFLVSTPLIILILVLIMRQTLPSYKKIQAGQDELSALTGENLSGVRVIRAFSKQEEEARRYHEAAQELTNLTVRAGRLSAALNPLTTLVVHLAIIAIVWLGAGQVFQGRLEGGKIIALVSYMNQTLLALIVAANIIVLFTRALASTKRIGALLATAPAVVQEAVPSTPEGSAKGDLLTFEHVTFSYHEGVAPAISDLSFSVKRGETIGVIGGTGSGKSTVTALILRFYDPQSGSIYLNGKNLRGEQIAAVRQRVSLVPQQARLFAGSLRENMQMALPGAGDEEIWAALKAAQASAFVEKLPGGLDYVIEPAGTNLSGGQRQRLTIARALLPKGDLLILDDAASALDYATDAALRKALAKRKAEQPEQALMLIGQRVASLKHADRILVLNQAGFAGFDAHETLVQDNEVYREICRSQGIAVPGDAREVAG